MVSECARATTAAESRFRVAAPNSRPRAVTVVALDRGAEAALAGLAAAPRGETVFAAAAGDPGSGDAVLLRDLRGRPLDLIEEIGRAHLVVLIATAGADASRAAVIGELCRWSGVTVTALVVGDPEPAGSTVSATVAQLRATATMLVTTTSGDYLADMLAALRA